jgi:hypothetical protein
MRQIPLSVRISQRRLSGKMPGPAGALTVIKGTDLMELAWDCGSQLCFMRLLNDVINIRRRQRLMLIRVR